MGFGGQELIFIQQKMGKKAKDPLCFVGGIDTDCGKTFITGKLAARFLLSGYNPITQKPVQTGDTGFSSDILSHRQDMGCGLLPVDIEGKTCSYLFSAPASPHLAARLENQTIDPARITKDTEYLSGKFDIVLIELAGGLMVPINDELLAIDYVKDTGLPLILVGSSRLGSINHTLLSVESCLHRGINLKALIYNRLPGTDEIIADESYTVIKKFMSSAMPNCPVIDFCNENKVLDSFISLF